MKSVIIAALLLVGTFTKSFAGDGTVVEPTVLKSFHATFSQATEVDWSLSQEMYKAHFFLNGQYITAYFREDGSMQALTRHITASALPLLLQTGLKNEHGGMWVSDVLEVSSEGSLQYYATLENADTKVILKSSSTSWTNYQKQRKD